MDKDKKGQTFKDLLSNLKEEDSKIDFNKINEISKKEDNNENKNDSFNNIFKEAQNLEQKEAEILNNIIKETPSLIEETKKEENTIEEPPTLFDNPKETINNAIEYTNPLFDNKNEIVNTDKEVNPLFETENNVLEKEEPNINPLFDNKEEKQEIIETPIIFKDEPEKTNKEETKENKIEKQIVKDKPSKKETEFKPKQKENKIEDVLDKNPFFIDDNNEESDNSNLVDDKINLVENKKHSISKDELSKIDTSNAKHFNVKIVKKKDPPIKFIIGVISYAIFIWLLLIGIALLIYVADIKLREAKGDTSSPTYNAYVVLTGSMLPDIQVYDVVLTKKTEAKDLKEGDIITFASSDARFLNTIITHRIIKKYYDSEKKQYTFQTKGDNNNVADSALVQANNIYGKVILKIPKLGYLQEFLATKSGWILVILLPCLAVISYDVVKLAKGLKRKKYKNIKVQK